MNVYRLFKKAKQLSGTASDQALKDHEADMQKIVTAHLKKMASRAHDEYLKTAGKIQASGGLIKGVMKKSDDFEESVDWSDDQFDADYAALTEDIFAASMSDAKGSLLLDVEKSKAAIAKIKKALSVKAINKKAVDFAGERSAQLVTMVTDTTKATIRGVVARGLEDGLTKIEIAQNIQNSTGFGDARASKIARTEIVNAHVSGNVHAWHESGVVSSYEWITSNGEGTCEDCSSNDGEVRKFGEAFPSGALSPPEHPNCLCDLLPVVDKDEE